MLRKIETELPEQTEDGDDSHLQIAKLQKTLNILSLKLEVVEENISQIPKLQDTTGRLLKVLNGKDGFSQIPRLQDAVERFLQQVKKNNLSKVPEVRNLVDKLLDAFKEEETEDSSSTGSEASSDAQSE